MKVIILTSNETGTASRCIPVLAASDKIEIVSVVLSNGAQSHKKFDRLKKKLKKALKIGPLGALNGIRIRNWFRGKPTKNIESICSELNLPLHRVNGINNDETEALFKAANADLGLSLGNSYIASHIFSVPHLGMINVHSEKLPAYQNAQSILWNIYNMDETTGLTIHQVDNKIDTGRIVYQEEYPIDFHAALQETVETTVDITCNKVPAAVLHVCENYDALIKDAKPQGSGDTYTTPSIFSFMKMIFNNRRLLKKQRRT